MAAGLAPGEPEEDVVKELQELREAEVVQVLATVAPQGSGGVARTGGKAGLSPGRRTEGPAEDDEHGDPSGAGWHFADPPARALPSLAHEIRSQPMKGRKGRKNKKQAQKRRQVQVRLKKKQRLERVLSALGLLKGFRELPSHVRNLMIHSLPSKPAVGIETAASNRPEMAELKTAIEQALEKTGVPTNTGQVVPLAEFFTTAGDLGGAFTDLMSVHLPRKYRPFVAEAAEQARAFYADHEVEGCALLGAEVQVNLLLLSRLDEQVFGCLLATDDSHPGNRLLRFTLCHGAVGQARVEIDGQERRVLRCGLPDGVKGILWPEGEAATFNLPAGRKYPIFFQPHALRRLRERLPLGMLSEVHIQLGRPAPQRQPHPRPYWRSGRPATCRR
jgi:hypothetical protein